MRSANRCVGRVAQGLCCGSVAAGSAASARQRVEREDLDVGIGAASGVVEDRVEPIGRARDAVDGVQRGEQALAERVLLAAADRCGAMRSPPRARRAPRRCDRARGATRPRCTRASAARRTSPVASAFSIASSQRAARRSRRRRPGTAPVRGSTPGTPRSAGTRAGVTARRRARGAATASSNRCSSRASSPSIASPRACSHGSSTAASQRSTWSRASRRRARGRRRRSRHVRRTASWRPGPTAGRALRRARRRGR